MITAQASIDAWVHGYALTTHRRRMRQLADRTAVGRRRRAFGPADREGLDHVRAVQFVDDPEPGYVVRDAARRIM